MSTNTPGNGTTSSPAPAPAPAPTPAPSTTATAPTAPTTGGGGGGGEVVRLSAERWSRVSGGRLGVAPEIVRAALKGNTATELTYDDVQEAVKAFLDQPADKVS